MQAENPVQMVLCTQDPALGSSFSAAVAHWAAEQCVAAELHQAAALPGAGPDVLFLDVDSAGLRGPERPKALARTALIAISACPGRAIEAHRWHAAAFLPPNAAPEQLRRAMDSCFAAWRGGLQWLDLSTRRDRVHLPLCQLRYAEARGRESSLYCAGGFTIQVGVPIKKLEQTLPSPPFFRCQKAFVIHLSGVAGFAAGQLTMKEDGRQISVSRQRIAPLRQALRRWQEDGTKCVSRL